MPEKINTQQQSRARSLRDAGYKNWAIADELGVSTDQVRRLLRKQCNRTYSQRVAAELIRDGFDPAVVAANFGGAP